MVKDTYEHGVPSWVDLGAPDPGDAAGLVAKAVVADPAGAVFSVIAVHAGPTP